MTRYIIALVLALLAAMAMAVPASAHAELKSSNPASGSTLDAPPNEVALTFSEVVRLLPGGNAVTVTGPDGVVWPVDQATIADKTVTAVVQSAGAKAGAHTLAWKVESADGDVVSGTFTFTLAQGAPPSSAQPPTSSAVPNAPVSNAPPSTTPASEGGIPAWVWIVIGLVVVVGAILLVRRRRS